MTRPDLTGSDLTGSDLTGHDNVPYADPEPLAEVIEECRCVQAECAAHGVSPSSMHPQEAHPAPTSITDTTQHLVDGYSDYGG